MKTYYLVAEKSAVNGYAVSVRDNPNNCEVLKEFQAENYPAAVKMFSFSAKNMGKTVYCGISADGKPFHGEA